MWPEQADRFVIKIVLTMLAMAALVLVVAARRGGWSAARRRLLDVSLVVLALAAVASYFEYGWVRFGRYMNPHDTYHYYIGAKYSQEHKYTNLYRCALIADQESAQPRFTGKRIRNLETHAMEPVAMVLKDRQKLCKDGFTAERWDEFARDVLWFRDMVPQKKWEHMVSDKGYNATPVWNSLARSLANRSPTSSEWSMLALTLIDPILLALAFSVVFIVFGWRVGSLVLIYYGLAYWMSHVHIKGAFLRLDWIACMLLAMCALKRRRHGLAGALMAWAAMARVFPVVFAAGLGAKLLLDVWQWWKARKAGTPEPFQRDRLIFFAAFLGSVLLLVALSAMADGGFHLWRSFAHKIAVHDADISSTRVGFKYVWLVLSSDKAAAFAQTKWLYWPVVGLAIGGSMWLMRRRSDVETVAFSFLVCFFLVAPTFYYYVVLVVPFLGFAASLDKRRIEAAALGLYVVSLLLYLVDRKVEEPIVFGVASFLLLAFCGLLVWVLRGHAPDQAPTETAGYPMAGSEHPVLTVRRLVAAAVVVVSLLLVGVFGLLPMLIVQPRDGLARQPLEETLKPDERELLFGGDIMLSRDVAGTMTRLGKTFEFPFDVVRPVLERADFSFANLECPISGRGEKVEKTHTFNAPPEAVRGVASSGLDAVSLANNHTLDYGLVALADTEQALQATPVKYVGVTDGNEPQPPLLFDARGLKIGLLAYCDPESAYGCAKEFDAFPRGPARAFDDVLARDIAALRPQVELLVVSMHWGKEYRHDHNERQQALAHRLIDLGVDIVAGHHPHVQQGHEIYRDKLILYSMGNFVFDQRSRADLRESRLYRVVVKKGAEPARLARASYWPLEIPLQEWQPRPRDDEGFVLVHRFDESSAGR